MLDILFVAVVAGVVPILINKTTESHFDFIKPHLRQVWTALFVFFSLYYLEKPYAKEMIVQLHREWKGSPWLGYVVSGLCGAAILCLYWWLTGKLLSKTQTQPPSQTSGQPESQPPSPLNQPHTDETQRQAMSPKHKNNHPQAQPEKHIEQRSYGPNSPNIVGNVGSLNINSSLPPRRIPESQRAEIIAFLSSRPHGKIQISAIANDPEAYQLAKDLYDVLLASGWEMSGQIPVGSFLVTGAVQTGVLIEMRGESLPPNSTMSLSDADPLSGLVVVLDRLKITAHAQRHPDMKEGVIYLMVYPRPLA